MFNFVLIVFVHPYCAPNSCCITMPCRASCMCADKTFQTNIGLVAIALTLLVVFSQMVGNPQCSLQNRRFIFFSRLLLNSNRAAVIGNQILIQTLIGPFINNKMNAFFKLLVDSNFE